MSMILFLSVLAITVSSLAGIIFSWKFLSGWIETKLRYLVATASGIFIVVMYDMLREVLSEGEYTIVATSFMFGVVFIWLATTLIPHHHHHSAHTDHTHDKIDARRVLIGDAVHNIHDGIVIVPAFLISNAVGLATASAILIHETVQEIAQFFILREAGYTTRQALVRNLFAQLTIWIGVALSIYLMSTHHLEVPLVAFAAGGFAFIVFRDLLPSVITHAKKEGRLWAYVVAFTFGLALMYTIITLVPHEHPEDELELPNDFHLV